MATKVDFEWRGSNSGQVKRLVAELEKRLTVIALEYQRAVVVSFPSPPKEPDGKGGFKKNSSKKWKRKHRSAPGGVPFVQTGHLRRSVAMDKPSPLIRRVGLGIGNKKMVNYGWWLEFGTRRMAPRPFMRPMLNRMRTWMMSVLKRKVRIK
jgi:hypothetical protein